MMKRPHVCFVGEGESFFDLLTEKVGGRAAGAAVQQKLIAQGLRRLGYEITFLVSDYGQPDVVTTSDGINLVKTRPSPVKESFIRRMTGLMRLFRVTNRVNPDICYQQARQAITGVMALNCRLRGHPFVYSVASNTDLDIAKRFELGFPDWRIYRYGLTMATEIVAQSEDQMNTLKEDFGRQGVLIQSTFTKPDESEKNLEKRHILWVGNLRKVRRPEMFLEVAERLPEYKFVLVGGKYPGQESLFDQIAERAGSIPHLEMAGAVDYDDVGRYFSEAFLFVNTTLVEGFPNTYLQAWCRGVPVVGTFDADGLIAKHGLGRACSSVDELVDGVRDFMKDDAPRMSAGEKALNYVEANHSEAAVVGAYDRLFMRLYESSPA